MFLCLAFLMLSRLFIAALWSPTGKGLTSWPLLVMFIIYLLLSCLALFLCLAFLMLSRLFIAALWSPTGKGLTSWPLLVMFIIYLLLSHVVSWISCGN